MYPGTNCPLKITNTSNNPRATSPDTTIPSTPFTKQIIDQPINYHDDDCISNDTYDSHETTNSSIPSMQNILLNHPSSRPELFIKETINTANINVPVDTVPLDVITPFNATVIAVGDNGSNIH